jgi:hypothetical protein
MNFHGAAKDCDPTRVSTYSGVSLFVRQRAPEQAYGGCGGSLRGKRRARKRGMAATDFPPQGFRAAIDRASTSCEVSAMSE